MNHSASTARGIILLAHGSRDPQWRTPIEAIAARIRARQPGTPVCCAYLELCPPSLPETAAALIAAGACQIRVFPIFFGIGKHAREDLPRLIEKIRVAHPEVMIELLPSAGELHQLTELMTDIALS
ncbi:MAG: sirohydrochlorin chelatase [Polaromonas sp.]